MDELTSSTPIIHDIKNAFDTVLNMTTECFTGMIYDNNVSATNIWKYFSPVLIICGTVGNALSIAVFRFPEMRPLALTRMLITLAILDIVVLTFTLIPKWLQFGLNLFGDYEGNTFGSAWQIQIWLAQSVGMIDHWFMVLISIERAFSVFRPLSTWLGRYKSTSCCIRFGTLCFVCILLNSYIVYDFVWHSKKQVETSLITTFKDLQLEYRICWPDSSHKRTMKTWRIWTMTFTFLIPFLFIMSINTAILCKLHVRYGGQLYCDETEKKRANAGTERVSIEVENKVDRIKKTHCVREGKWGKKGRKPIEDNNMKRDGKGEWIKESMKEEKKEVQETQLKEKARKKNKNETERKVIENNSNIKENGREEEEKTKKITKNKEEKEEIVRRKEAERESRGHLLNKEEKTGDENNIESIKSKVTVSEIKGTKNNAREEDKLDIVRVIVKERTNEKNYESLDREEKNVRTIVKQERKTKEKAKKKGSTEDWKTGDSVKIEGKEAHVITTEKKELVSKNVFQTRFDGMAIFHSNTAAYQAQRNIRAYLVVNFVFLVTDLPLVTYLTVFLSSNITNHSRNFLVYTICNQMMYLRHTFSFFVFGISKQFRKSVVRLSRRCAVTIKLKKPCEDNGTLERSGKC